LPHLSCDRLVITSPLHSAKIHWYIIDLQTKIRRGKHICWISRIIRKICTWRWRSGRLSSRHWLRNRCWRRWRRWWRWLRSRCWCRGWNYQTGALEPVRKLRRFIEYKCWVIRCSNIPLLDIRMICRILRP
jgi:hypothetical protein